MYPNIFGARLVQPRFQSFLPPCSLARRTLIPKVGLSSFSTQYRGSEAKVPINDKGDGGGSGGEPPVDPEAEAKAFFETEMHPLVYPTCYLSCHQAGGVSGGSDLVLVGPGPNQIAANNSAFVNFITVFSSSATLLTRISGGGHPGGAIYTNGSSQYQVIETWTQFYD